MITTLYTAKAGQGATVTAAALALTCPGATLLLDASTGDLPAVLAAPDTPTTPAGTLSGAIVSVTDPLDLLAPGPLPASPEHLAAVTALAARYQHVIIDAGTNHAWTTIAEQTLLVTRPCYLAVRAAIAQPIRPSGIIVIAEAGRALTPNDLEAVLGAPVVATIPIDPTIARAVDAGLLAAPLPRSLARAVRPAHTLARS